MSKLSRTPLYLGSQRRQKVQSGMNMAVTHEQVPEAAAADRLKHMKQAPMIGLSL